MIESIRGSKDNRDYIKSSVESETTVCPPNLSNTGEVQTVIVVLSSVVTLLIYRYYLYFRYRKVNRVSSSKYLQVEVKENIFNLDGSLK